MPGGFHIVCRNIPFTKEFAVYTPQPQRCYLNYLGDDRYRSVGRWWIYPMNLVSWVQEEDERFVKEKRDGG